MALLLLGVSSCNPTKRLQEGEYLVNRVKIKNEDTNISNERILSAIKQRPNRRIFAIGRFHLHMYNIPNPNKLEKARIRKDKRIEKRNQRRKARGNNNIIGYKPTKGEWFREVVGEAPVILDTLLAIESKDQLSLLMQKKGYFNNTVDVKIKKKEHWPGKNRAKIIYTLHASEPYHIDSIIPYISDENIKPIYEAESRNSIINTGDQFDVEKLDQERNRITKTLRNNGYYFFVKEYIDFEIDSIGKNNKVNVNLFIRDPKKASNNSKHKAYEISDVLINYNINSIKNINRDTINIAGYRFIDSDDFPLDPKVIMRNTFIKSGEKFQETSVEQTYRRLLALEVISIVNIRFVVDPNSDDKLTAIIDLSFNKRMSFAIETTGTTNSGTSLGVQASTVFKHKNIFHAGEVLNFKIAGGIESQNLVTDNNTNEPNADIFRLNTIEFGPELSLKIPRLLLPIKNEKLNNSNPITTISTAYNFQSRPDYKRSILQASLGYRLKETKKNRILFNPIEVNIIKIEKDQAFIELLNEINDKFLSDSYQNHFILATKASFISKTRNILNSRLLFFNRTNVEGAGNFLNLVSPSLGLDKNDDNSYELLDIAYAQYIKASNDLRLYRKMNTKSSIAYRLYTGIGIPLTNLNVLPFSKSFIGGGANGIRAWKSRSLGPGSYFEPKVNYDKIGDIHIESNIEYRFDLISYLEGAFFIDAGNIWLFSEDSLRVGSQFKIQDFASEIAVGAGIGARLNFEYFIVRFDLAMQIKDPSLPKGERWIYQEKDKYNEIIGEYNSALNEDDRIGRYRSRLNFNLGIGYPF